MKSLSHFTQLILCSLLMWSYQCYATIQHNDITDIVVSGNTSADIDFDGDGTPEFTLSDQGFGATEVGTFFDPAKVNFVTQTATWDAFDPITAGTTIDANSGYNAAGDCYFNPFWANTVFPVGADTYIGVQFTLGTATHYAWVLVNLAANGEVTVKSYAYEDNAGTGIAAGATSSAVLVTGITAQGQGNATTVVSGNTLTMEATVLPANATNAAVTWSVTNGTGTGTINPTTGILTGGNAGTVTVTALAADGSGISDDVVITVTPNIILVTGITVQGQGSASTVVSGNTLTMEATVLPANATNAAVTWSVTNGTGTATINPTTGVLTGGTAGTVTVTALAADGSGISGDATITITQATSISTLEQQNVQLFPNPAKKHVYLKTSSNGLYQIYNLQGMMVQEGVVLEGTQALDLKDLPQGVYVIRLTLETMPEMAQTLIVE